MAEDSVAKKITNFNPMPLTYAKMVVTFIHKPQLVVSNSQLFVTKLRITN